MALHCQLNEAKTQNVSLFSTTCDLQETIKKASEYDLEIPQSQTADNPMAPRGRAAQPS